jgi:glucose-1-phosphate cytidylyltransferase
MVLILFTAALFGQRADIALPAYQLKNPNHICSGNCSPIALRIRHRQAVLHGEWCSGRTVVGRNRGPEDVKVVILAGGYGSRLAEETEIKPKPMVEIGGKPILWHILKHFSHFGHREFFVALGYKGDEIKRYFVDRTRLNGDVTIKMASGELQQQGGDLEDWTVHLVDTGRDTLTGGRTKRLQPCLQSQTFMVTYGDGVADVDLAALLQFHKDCGRLATVTAVRPPARFGGLIFEGSLVARFTEKPQAGEGWINGGYLVFEPGVFRYFSDRDCSLEAAVLEKLAADRQLAAYRHDGFWQCMDTLRDKRLLESLWQTERAPWKVWP